jgi:hypothetical protein
MLSILPVAVALAAVLMPSLAFAQETGGVVIPVGDWAQALLLTMLSVVTPAVAWALRGLPKHVRWILAAARIEQLLTNALQDAINRTAGAVAGKTYTLDTGIDLANKALAYAVTHAPTLVREFGLDDLWGKILARIPFDEDVAVPADVQPRARSLLARAAK